MTATNHALAGSTIALVLHGSWLALPLALASHFILDALPHFGSNHESAFRRSKQFSRFLSLDITGAVIIALAVCLAQPPHWEIVALSAFLATSPDIMWVGRFWRARHGQKDKPFKRWHWLMRFHSRIQWFERPIGAFVEVAWLAAFGSLLFSLLR